MIRIRRGSAPAILSPVRSKGLKSARLDFAAGTLNKATLKKTYVIAKDELCERQHFKCCYCERNNIEPGFNDVEHYRPKLRADRGPGFPTHGYWWLAWTWQNLMFACPNCNRSEKNDKFPLVAGSTALVHEQKPPILEIPLLIDPSKENPIIHIRFTHFPGLAKHRWIPLPRAGSAKGNETIRVLGLARPSLLDLYDNHVNHYVTPVINRLSAAISSSDIASISSIWSNELLVLLLPTRPFTGLSYDALDQLLSKADRKRFSLQLKKPS